MLFELKFFLILLLVFWNHDMSFAMKNTTSSTESKQSLTTLHLSKQNFKFSAAHFLIFDEKHAEKLHGHNYQVKVDIAMPASADLQTTGYFVDFQVLKKLIKAKLDKWDEVILLPQKNPEMKLEVKSPSIEVHFRERFYVFPENEVVLLPITNTSVELLSQLLAQLLISELRPLNVYRLRVNIEETRGQSASSTVFA
jgi:6-pyruvoyltetrahydropterin/6-carboxytetrahydropterin synthase